MFLIRTCLFLPLIFSTMIGWTCEDHPKGIAPGTAAALTVAHKENLEVPPGPVITIPPTAINTTQPLQEAVASLDAQLKDPTTANLKAVRQFAEGLWPIREPSIQENQTLAVMLNRYAQERTPAALQSFVDEHSDSPWRGSVALNLGLLYRREGRFSKAMVAWSAAWNHLRAHNESPQINGLADRAAGELAQLLSWVGEQDRLAELLQQTKGRSLTGPGGVRLEAAEMALNFMRSNPEVTFTCGPFGIDTLCRLAGKSSTAADLIKKCPATKSGTNLLDVSKLADDIGLSCRPAKRVASVDIPLPAIVHWRLGHFSVLTKQQGNRYLIVDQTFDGFQGRELWISKEALEEETSGYFLITIDKQQKLPDGWEAGTEKEFASVWGKGAPAGIDPDQPGNIDGDCTGMPIYRLSPSQISLLIADRPIGYRPPRGAAIDFTMKYNSKESHLPSIPITGNLGPKWNHNWLSYLVEDPQVIPTVQSTQYWNPDTMQYYTVYTVTAVTTTVECYPQGGGYERYSITRNYNDPRPGYRVITSGVSAPFFRSQNTIQQLGDNSYQIVTKDRQLLTYNRVDGSQSYPRRVLLSSIADFSGNTVNLSYDASNRLTGITDALGRVTTLTYGNSDPTKITRVTDPFGRKADFTYTNGVLTQVTDVIGLSSSFGYETGTDVINQMTTPYGTTQFSRGTASIHNGYEDLRYVEATDLAGDKERVEMVHGTYFYELPSSDPDVDVPTGMLTNNANIKYTTSFYFDKKAMRLAPGDRLKAKNFGFARLSGNLVTDVLEFIKQPNENRVWFNYPGQGSSSIATGITLNAPSAIGRVIDDNSTQLYQAAYNSRGKITESIDPLGRKITNVYDANGFNLTEVRMNTAGANELLMKATYNSQQLPENVTDANGRVMVLLYNSFGQPLSMTLPQRAGKPVEKNQYTYNAQGFLTKITDPINGMTDFTYDGYDRIRTVTDRDGYLITLDYDNLDRLTKVTFPDGTYTQTNYNRLDAEWSRDREGRWTRMWYNYLRQIVAMRDSQGRVTGLSWCRCGALSSLIDPMNRLTSWNYDLQGRLTSKVFPDGKMMTYAYQPKSGRLASQTDAMGQTTLYDYFHDNAIKQISYPNALIATPTVSYAYDGNYGRLGTMTDGTGITNYAYASVPTMTPSPATTGAGQLLNIDGPLTNDTITFNYDEWSRTVGSAIGGVGSSVLVDAIGRVTQLNNALGQFNYAYVNATRRLNNVVAPNGMKTIMAYQTLANDFRVASIRHETSTATRIGENSYAYSPQGRIDQWTQQADNATQTVWSYGYDKVDQLISARANSGTSTGALIKEYAWAFDNLGNRLSERLSTGTSNAVGKSNYNDTNQLLSTAGGGRVQIKGQIDEPGTVTVNNSPVQVNPDKTFTAEVDTQTGQNTFDVKATDLKGNIRTNQFRLDTTLNGAARILTYDLNGNCTQDGATTYQWDAENQLVKITTGTKTSEFTYDGAGRRVRIVEKDGATTLSDHRFVWLGSRIIERRNAAGDTVQIRYLGSGEVEGATKRYYTRDHLGSIREVVSQTGGVLARYDYSPFGERVRVGGSDVTYECQFGYTGHYHHKPTGMALTWYRAYVPGSGRWLSRDPIGEAGGVNLYAYVGNDSINHTDPLGLMMDSVSVTCRANPAACAAMGIGVGAAANPANQRLIPQATQAITATAQACSNAIPRLTSSAAPNWNYHHILSLFRGTSGAGQKYRDFFQNLGISPNIRDQYTVKLPQKLHTWLHSPNGFNWNQKWKDWIDANPNATAKEVYQFAGQLMDKAGIASQPITAYPF